MQTALSCNARPLLRVAGASLRANPLRAAPGVAARRPTAAGRAVVFAGQKPADFDFDEFLQQTADKFETVENKPVVVGYLLAAVSAVFVAEWFIHLPLFNALIGFPVQLLGLAVTPYLALRYWVDKDGDVWDDAEALVGKVVKQLPGLGK